MSPRNTLLAAKAKSSRVRYMPHQGAKEKARRMKKFQTTGVATATFLKEMKL